MFRYLTRNILIILYYEIVCTIVSLLKFFYKILKYCLLLLFYEKIVKRFAEAWI